MTRLLVFVLFFLSGAASLAYEVTWVRFLGLVFGASHLAVTTVLSVYMGGQAVGSALLGRWADRTSRPLRLYGLLELGIGASAVVFLAVMAFYPRLYGALVGGGEASGLYVTVLRTALAAGALLVPTALMGGTLPVLARFASQGSGPVARQLSLLYAVNTLGAMTGVLVSGFLLLKTLGVTNTLLAAAALSTAVGLAAVWLPEPRGDAGSPGTPAAGAAEPLPREEGRAAGRARRAALVGIGVSGFCALGYEVLWTRMLSLVLGTSVYSFAIMLSAFLAGIGLGSRAYSPVRRWLRDGAKSSAVLFGATQVLVGLTALAVTVAMRDLPNAAAVLQGWLVQGFGGEFGGRLAASFVVAFSYMFVPALFMGLAFPAAAAVWSEGGTSAGGSVGRLLSANTVGAILGSAGSGFVLIYLFGIERALQMLVVLNLAAGVVAAGSVARARWPVYAAAAAAVIVLVARAAAPGWGRVWDQKYFAAFTNNSRAVESRERIREKLSNLDVLYYHEGVNETVSVTRSKGRVQSFIVNGRPEASTSPVDVQLQEALGHIPMLLHPDPRRVFVLGTGTGMTLGATSVHPEVERLVLGEIERAVLGVARTFDRWNSRVLDNPKLRIVFNDGRNFLSTTPERFDVITADPIHPWSGGAAYLYTAEYFRSVASRLAPGGIAAQWLPLYELSVGDVQTIVKTFAASFPHVQVWLLYYDAVLVGSNAPISVDEASLARRMANPAIRKDLAPVQMASPDALLSHFLMGTAGARAFGAAGKVNTDDNLFLEFSAPGSQGLTGLEGRNVAALSPFRESLLPHLRPASDPGQRNAQAELWGRRLETGRLFDEAHARFLLGDRESPAFRARLRSVEARDPEYAPLRFLQEWMRFWERSEPALVASADFPLRPGPNGAGALRVSAVRQYLGWERVLVSFVDNERRVIYGQHYVDGDYEALDRAAGEYVARTFETVRSGSAPAWRAGVPGEAEATAALRAAFRQTVGPLEPGGSD